MHIKKQRLLTPGPTPLLPRALHAMMGSDIHHRTEDFRKLYKSVLTGLKDLLKTESDIIVLVSSGTGGLEAAVVNFLNAGDKVIICVAGKFGERFEGMAKTFGLNAVVLREEYGSVVRPERVEQALAEHPDAKAVMVQASETSTGAAHDIKRMGLAVKKTNAIMVVDAVTGLGTMPLDIDGWGLDVVVSGSQKSFMIPPGLGFLSISKKAWAAADQSKTPRFYFDLKREQKNAVNGESAWTPNTSLMLALQEAITYVNSIGGLDKLVENAQLLARATREAAQALGLELFSPESPAASVTAIRAPKGIDSSVIVKEFRSKFGAIIANGQGTMKGQIFRIAHLGYFDFMDLFALVAALELILQTNGHEVELGKGVAAVQRVYAEVAMPAPVGV
jgi:aspartate aminotransferase-like enzyme